MEIKYQTSWEKSQAEVLVLFFHQGKTTSPKSLPEEAKKALEPLLLLEEEALGKKGKMAEVYAKEGRILCVGLGKLEELDEEQLRRALGKTGNRLQDMEVSSALVFLPEGKGVLSQENVAEQVVLGLSLGSYRFLPYKTPSPEEKQESKSLEALCVVDEKGVSSKESALKGLALAQAVGVARDLGNHPGNRMTPTDLAKEAEKLAKEHGFGLEVLEKEALEKLGFGLMLGVAGGSVEKPKLVVLDYNPQGESKETLLLVGKGITFDSGGISIKPSAAMEEMKFDMCGGAAVLGCFAGLGKLKPKNLRVVGMVPACENLPGGRAVKPGDILQAYNKKTVEVLNTDAEGRLILADALSYGIEKYQPKAVIDLATLTGACVVAFGKYATGALSNNAGLQEKLEQAGRKCGEIIWPMPDFPEYDEELKGTYADLQNIGSRYGGAITAGMFLKHFVGETPWVHLDIAGTAWDVGKIGYNPKKGATGVGVRLLMEIIENWK